MPYSVRTTTLNNSFNNDRHKDEIINFFSLNQQEAIHSLIWFKFLVTITKSKSLLTTINM